MHDNRNRSMVGVKRRCNLRRMSHEVGEMMNEMNEKIDLSSQYASDLVKFQQVQWLRSAYGFGYRYSETTAETTAETTEDTDRYDNDYERRRADRTATTADAPHDVTAFVEVLMNAEAN